MCKIKVELIRSCTRTISLRCSEQKHSLPAARFFIIIAPKSENIRTIAQQLNIGLDTFAFIDDNPFELEEVSRALKGVTCVNAADIDNLFSSPRYQGATNEDARKRSQFYREEFVRRKSATQFGSDYLGFLAACEIKLFVDLYTDEDLERVSELVQRTNQLNFSGRKYQRSEILPILANQEIEKYVLRCMDNYGSYGAVGFCIVRTEESEIRVEDFMLSCRVQGSSSSRLSSIIW
ncbi:FkbH-like protein [Nitrosospira multiformis]|uniref:FkbH-like protein n=1 Tax=Nitrosospira multiformis TaxID=1231 RepID=A0A2T5IG70_9PROT|nr:FkbH-like protein [Nitrosospira multiformis]